MIFGLSSMVSKLAVATKLSAVSSMIACCNLTYVYTWDAATRSIKASYYNGENASSIAVEQDDLKNAHDIRLICTNEYVVLTVNGHDKDYVYNSCLIVYDADLKTEFSRTTHPRSSRIVAHATKDSLYILTCSNSLKESLYKRGLVRFLSTKKFDYEGVQSTVRGNDRYLVLATTTSENRNNSLVTVIDLETDKSKIIYVYGKFTTMILGKDYVYFQHDSTLSRCPLATAASQPITFMGNLDIYRHYGSGQFSPEQEYYICQSDKETVNVLADGEEVLSYNFGKKGGWKLIGHYLFIVDSEPVFLHGKKDGWVLFDLSKSKPADVFFQVKADGFTLESMVLEPCALRLEGSKTRYLPLPGKTIPQLRALTTMGMLSDYFEVFSRYDPIEMGLSHSHDVMGDVLESLYDDQISSDAWNDILHALSSTYYFGHLNTTDFERGFAILLALEDPYIMALMFIAYGEGLWGVPQDGEKALMYYQGADRATIRRYYRDK